MDSLYNANQYQPIWLRENKTIPEGNSFINLIQNSRLWGLFPNDYHYNILAFIDRAFSLDTNAARNAALWARKDLLLTDAFFLMAKHLKQGRIPYDSVTLRTDTLFLDSFYTSALNQALQSGNVSQVLHNLEPKWKGYDSLKAYIGAFPGLGFICSIYLPALSIYGFNQFFSFITETSGGNGKSF